jgi:hypothetical protein
MPGMGRGHSLSGFHKEESIGWCWICIKNAVGRGSFIQMAFGMLSCKFRAMNMCHAAWRAKNHFIYQLIAWGKGHIS